MADKRSATGKKKLQRKGGRRFPRESLKDAVGYAEKLVSKTHTAPQPRSIIYPGVFNSNSSVGEIRASATKQYGLMEGNTKALKATRLAKDIVAASPAGKKGLLAQAALKPTLFKELYETFQDDSVTKAQIRQQASNLDVHPDFLESAVDLFVEALAFAGLAEVAGDTVRIGKRDASDESRDDRSAATAGESENEDIGSDNSEGETDSAGSRRARAVIQVNVTLDSSLDTDKLERQLELLKRYGAL